MVVRDITTIMLTDPVPWFSGEQFVKYSLDILYKVKPQDFSHSMSKKVSEQELHSHHSRTPSLSNRTLYALPVHRDLALSVNKDRPLPLMEMQVTQTD